MNMAPASTSKYFVGLISFLVQVASICFFINRSPYMPSEQIIVGVIHQAKRVCV
jgi:hypothetical protein